MNRYLNALKTFTVTCILAAGVMLSIDALAWCGGDGTSDCSATINNQIDQNSPYYQGGSYGGNRGGTSVPVYIPTKPSKFGAVAIDSANGIWGYSVLQPSKKAANLAAIADCGNSRCKIKANYANTCFAIAWGTDNKKGIFGIRGDILKSTAEQKALSACNKDMQNCKIIMSECTLP